MKAIVHSRYGPPDALELNDIDTPPSPPIVQLAATASRSLPPGRVAARSASPNLDPLPTRTDLRLRGERST
jgi:hypothetical protein